MATSVAEASEIRHYELRREFLKEGIPVKIGVESIAQAKTDAEALKQLNEQMEDR